LVYLLINTRETKVQNVKIIDYCIIVRELNGRPKTMLFMCRGGSTKNFKKD